MPPSYLASSTTKIINNENNVLIFQVGEQCLQVGSDNGPPSFRDYGDVSSRITLDLYYQAIIPSYYFTCYGEWTCINGGSRDHERYEID